jgi:hypothetical protein
MRSFATLAIVFAMILCCCATASATVLFQDNYDAKTPIGLDLTTVAPTVGWKVEATKATPVLADVSTEANPGATNATKFVGHANFVSEADLGYADWLEISPAHQAGSAGGVIEFKMDAWVGTDAALEFVTFASKAYAGGSWDVLLAKDGSVKEYSSSAGGYITKVAAGVIPKDAWIPITVLANYGAQTYQANVNGNSFSGAFQGGTVGSDSMMAWYVNRSSGLGGGVYYDNVSITYQGTIVPEPSSLALAALGLLSLVAYAWRKRK